MSTKPMNAPRYLQINPRDNVAIVVNEGCLPAGSQFKLTLNSALVMS